MKKYKLILSEDEYSTDALEVFEKEFEKVVGKTVKEFEKLAGNSSEYDDTVVYELEQYRLAQSAFEPYWILEKMEKDDKVN